MAGLLWERKSEEVLLKHSFGTSSTNSGLSLCPPQLKPFFSPQPLACTKSLSSSPVTQHLRIISALKIITTILVRMCTKFCRFGHVWNNLSAMNLAGAHVRIFSLDLVTVVQFLLDGEWVELRYCPVNAINRTAYEYARRARWAPLLSS